MIQGLPRISAFNLALNSAMSWQKGLTYVFVYILLYNTHLHPEWRCFCRGLGMYIYKYIGKWYFTKPNSAFQKKKKYTSSQLEHLKWKVTVKIQQDDGERMLKMFTIQAIKRVESHVPSVEDWTGNSTGIRFSVKKQRFKKKKKSVAISKKKYLGWPVHGLLAKHDRWFVRQHGWYHAPIGY